MMNLNLMEVDILLSEDRLKIADFGSCRGVKSKQPFTEYISTRWYERLGKLIYACNELSFKVSCSGMPAN